MFELFQDEYGAFVTEHAWLSKIGFLRKKSCSFDESVLTKSIIEAVKKRVPKGPFGLLFSGGVDSSTIAFLLKQQGLDFICYTVGFEGSKDVDAARVAAGTLGLKMREKVLTISEVENVVHATKNILEDNSVVSIGVGSVEYAALGLAAEDGITCLFGGLGSEEIFAGYQRHELAKDINEECWSGLEKMWARDLVRDSKIASHFNVNFRTPFLDEEVIIQAMAAPGGLKIRGGEKKYLLRKIAHEFGLEKSIAFRKKIAAQYGSGFDSAIEKIARKKGFKNKSDYIKSIA